MGGEVGGVATVAGGRADPKVTVTCRASVRDKAFGVKVWVLTPTVVDHMSYSVAKDTQLVFVAS